MSLFIGKVGSTPVLHITNTVTGPATIATATPIAETSFHSSLPYLLCTKYDITSTFISGKDNIAYFKIPDAAITDIVDNSHMFFITILIAGTWYFLANGTTQVTPINALIGFSSDPVNGVEATNVSSQYNYVQTTGDTTKAVVFTLNVLNKGVGYIPTTLNTSAGIHISNNDLTVMGNDLSTTIYVSNSTFNSTDIVSTGINSSTFQLLNTLNTGTGMALISDTSGTRILRGGEVIFNSAVIDNKVIFRDSVYTTVLSKKLHGGDIYDTDIPLAIFEGDMLLFSTLDINTPSNIGMYSSSVFFELFNEPLGGGTVRQGFLCTNNAILYRIDLTGIDSGYFIQYGDLSVTVASFM